MASENQNSNAFQSIGDRVAGLDGVEVDDGPAVEQIESLCMNCHENVRTRHNFAIQLKQSN